MRPRRRLLALLLLIASAAALLARRRASGERVDLYFEDGSMLALEGGSPQAERLLAIARAAL